MFNDLTNLGYGLVLFAIIIGVGSVILYNFGGAVGSCPTATCGATASWNSTDGTCWNATATCGSPEGTAYDNSFYLLGQLGESGLAGWTPAIIAISVGILFLGAFLIGNKGNKSKGRY